MRNSKINDVSQKLDIVNIRKKGQDRYEVLFNKIKVPVLMDKSYLDIVLQEIKAVS